MSILKLTYEIAHDIRDGRFSREDALADFGHLIDRETLDEILASFGSVRHEEDVDGEDVTVIRVPDSWKRTWSEEDPA